MHGETVGRVSSIPDPDLFDPGMSFFRNSEVFMALARFTEKQSSFNQAFIAIYQERRQQILSHDACR